MDNHHTEDLEREYNENILRIIRRQQKKEADASSGETSEEPKKPAAPFSRRVMAGSKTESGWPRELVLCKEVSCSNRISSKVTANFANRVSLLQFGCYRFFRRAGCFRRLVRFNCKCLYRQQTHNNAQT